MPISLPGRISGLGWSGPCTLVHVRSTTVVIQTEGDLSPGEVVEMEFFVSRKRTISLMGAVRLERSGLGWTIALIEQCDEYREFRESLTLIEKDAT